MRVVIIGGSAGGASVAARLRRLSESTEITLVEMSSTISFATCGIPYYLGGVITDRNRLNVVDQDHFANLLNVQLKIRSEVIAIDRYRKKILIQNHDSGAIYEYAWDKLVLATGSKPFIPDVINQDTQNNVFTLRNAEDTDTAQRFISENNCHNALIIGAGFIGLELAESLHKRGMAVTLLDNASHILGSCDAELTTMLHQQLESNGVRVILEKLLSSLTADKALLNDGQTIDTDVIFICTGTKPNVRYAQACKLAVGDHGGISVNNQLQTSDENIYALGDAVEVKNIITSDYCLKPFAGIAQKQARIVADNIFDMQKEFDPVQGTAVIKVFDLTIGTTGMSENQCKQASLNYNKTYIEAHSHAGFYPDAHPLIIKLLFYPLTGKILGAQIVGAKGVDKRLDIISSAIQFDKTVFDLENLELAYAPQFSSAKDPVNIAAMTAVNMIDLDYSVTHWHELQARIEDGATLVDIRLEEEYELQHIDGAVNIPLEQLRTRHTELPLDRKLIVYCRHGKKGYFAERLLKKLGHPSVSNLCGGQNIYELATRNRRNDWNQAPKPLNNVAWFQQARHPLYQTDTSANSPQNIVSIDAVGLDSQTVLASLKHEIKKCQRKELLKVIVSDLHTVQDIKTWVKDSDNKVISVNARQGIMTVFIQPGGSVKNDNLHNIHDTTNNPDNTAMPDQSTAATAMPESVPLNTLITESGLHRFGDVVIDETSTLLKVDACGLSCPGPIMKLSKTAIQANEGDMIQITATDTNFATDISTWSNKKGFRVLALENKSSKITAVLQKVQIDIDHSGLFE